jgi:hypothetical protein
MAWVKDVVIAPVWNAISGIISGAWNSMKGVLQGGINFFIDIFNALARAINAVASALGFGFRVPTAGHVSFGSGGGFQGGNPDGGGFFLESGGRVQAGGPGFMTNGIAAIVGEGNPMYPEYVIPTDPKYRKNALALLQSLGTKMFAAGGLLGDGPIPTPGDVLGGLVAGAWDKTMGVAKTFWNAIQWIRSQMGNMLPWMSKAIGKGIDMAVDWASEKLVGAAVKARDVAWEVGAKINPVDDVINLLGLVRGGTIPALANGGIIAPRPGGTLVRLGERGRSEAVQPLPSDWNSGVQSTYNFYGDLEFPNVKDGDDAEDFIRNLETLVSN